MSVQEQDYDDIEYDDDAGCSWCDGEGIRECDAAPLCWSRNCNGDFHDCPACDGSGLARDQRIW